MKKLIALIMALAIPFSLVGCDNGTPGNKPEDNRLITIDGLAEDLYPNLDAIDRYNDSTGGFYGKVDVEIVFGKTLPGWQAVKEAYEKIQTGVAINLNDNSDGTYTDKAMNAINNANTDWDIFQGNRVSNVTTAAINLSSMIYGENYYAGVAVDDPTADEGASKIWQDVLSQDAYITDKSGSNTSCYIMNSESLSTAWFVNQTAFAAAVQEGYVNSEGKAETPVTWDDLIALCAAMKKAGYTNPLGLAGDTAAVNDSQFAWIFRIYGDQYYRDQYPNINIQEGDKLYSPSAYPFDFSLTDPQPESGQGYNPSHSRFWNSLLDEENAYNGDKENLSYVGAKSDKFACFIENIYKIKEYIPADFTTLKFEDVRDRFISATATDKTKPAILLDYTGFGLTFGTEERGFEIDFFDYPAMTCSHEEKHVTTDFVRDVGGNGGYLSVMRHANDSKQDELTIDFLKFFMSPYGQSIYYQALQAAKIAPDGLSTVQNFAVPDTWKAFFESDKIQFNGLCDVNWYNNNFIYHVNGLDASRDSHVSVVHKLLRTGNYASSAEAVAAFQEEWDLAVRNGFDKLCESMRWSKTLWQRPGTSVTL